MFKRVHSMDSSSLSQTSGRSQELTHVTSAQIQAAREIGDKFGINEREVSQVHILGV